MNQTIVLRYRAAFGLGFVVLGLVTLWRVIAVAAPSQNKILGALLAIAMIGLGTARMLQYARSRQQAGL